MQNLRQLWNGAQQSSDLTDQCMWLLTYLQNMLEVYDYIRYNHNHRPQRFLFFPLSLFAFVYIDAFILLVLLFGALLLVSLHMHLLHDHSVILSTQKITSSLHSRSVRPKWRLYRLILPGSCFLTVQGTLYIVELCVPKAKELILQRNCFSVIFMVIIT